MSIPLNSPRGKRPITQGHTEPAAVPHVHTAWQRSRYRIAGHSFSYALDVNFSMLAGVVCKRPSPARVGNQTFVWSRIKHVDQGHRKRGIYLPLRFEGELAKWACLNLDQDDHVVATGRLWMGETRKRGVPTFYTWMQVERATCSMPVQLDQDDKFVRVRADLWNRMCMQIGEEATDLRVAEPPVKTMRYEDSIPYDAVPDQDSDQMPQQDPETP